MINEQNLPKAYCAEAANIPNEPMHYIWSARRNPPREVYGRKSDLSHLRIFDTIAYMHIPKEKMTESLSEIGEMHPRGVSNTDA